jgi:hypothetical protein
MTSGFKSLVGFVLALTNISKSSQCDFGMKHVFWGHLFLEVQTNGYCDLSRLCKLGCFHQMFVHASYIICVATPLWPKCGGEAQHFQSWGFGVLRDSRMFRARQQGPKHLALRCSWCHWKGLEA